MYNVTDSFNYIFYSSKNPEKYYASIKILSSTTVSNIDNHKCFLNSKSGC